MAKVIVEKISSTLSEENRHPYAFHVSGPRNLSIPSWRDCWACPSLWSKTKKNENYKRAVMACFVQAVYLLELDRQENRNVFSTEMRWVNFWCSAGWDSFAVMRPSGAPKAVLAPGGTLLKGPTIRRDIEVDFRFLAWESMEAFKRFDCTLDVLKSSMDLFGSCNVCFAGYPLGAGFALQVGKALAKQGVFVETHLFNPPSVTFSLSSTNIGEC
ncbi:hypothetical protein MKW98_019447 [Papaver atlanticum]|uniref:Uncharacterized protein n=1 Tax=Papaver atlanticum TaxID=357466 RepID=A0AAD4S991_9MAGN|nr:hypothetical protein MKW98_019447 [Papaver atlanticum]